MKKNSVFAGFVLLISMVVYNVAVFVFANNFKANFWCGYVFTMAAFLLQILFAFIAFGKADTLKKTFLGLPIVQLGFTYLVLQVIWGFLVIFVTAITASIGAVASVVLLGIYLIAIISAVAGREMVQATEDKVKVKTFYIKSLLVDVESLVDKTEDVVLKKNLKDLIDIIKYSDPMSSDSLFGIESKIEAKAEALINVVGTADISNAKSLISELQSLFIERNKKCKLLK